MSQDLNIYRCPKCKGSLSNVTTRSCLICESCGINFPVYRDAPILIDEESSVFRIEKIINQDRVGHVNSSVQSNYLLKIGRYFIKFIIRITPTLYSKKRAIEIARIFLERINELVGQKITVLSIGNGTGGLIFNELKNNPRFNLIETDIYIAPNRMFVSDIQQIPLDSQSVDVVLVEGVLEHVLDPSLAVSEIHRVLKPEGLVLSTTPFILGVHMEVADYTRFTRLGLLKLFQKFQPVECGVIEGAFVALAYQISYVFMTIAASITFGNSRAIKFAKYAGNFFIFWLKYIDLLTRDNPISQDSAVNLFYIGRKKNIDISDLDINLKFSEI
jgi:ubiquinone/menaquinone biosynthesis C-methylase UbiE/uncharacterized protein YbaR (Trm112 family)